MTQRVTSSQRILEKGSDGGFVPIESVCTNADSIQQGDPIAKALNHIVEKNPQKLNTTRANWRTNDSIKVNGPYGQATEGCTTKGL